MQARSFLVAVQRQSHLLSHDWLVLVLSLTSITQSNKSIHLAVLFLLALRTNHEECSCHVDVGNETVVAFSCGSDGGVDDVGILKVVPEFLSSELRESLTFINQESIPVVLVSTHVLIQVVGKLLSVQLYVSAVIYINQVLARTETVSESGGTEVDGFVVGVAVLGEAVAETDEGVDVKGGRLVLPGSDREEGAHDVAVDGQELVGVPAFHGCHVEEAGLGQVVPVFLTQGVIHKLVDIISVPLSLRRQPVPGEGCGWILRAVWVVVAFGLGVSKGEGEEGKEDDGLRSHGLFILSYLHGAHKESADSQIADLPHKRGIAHSERRKGGRGEGFYPWREELGTRREKQFTAVKEGFEGR